MILIEAGERTERSFEAKLIFCAQLAARGHDAVIDDAHLPATLDRNGRFEAAPYLRDLSGRPIDRLVMIGAAQVADEVLLRLRQLEIGADAPLHLFGRFADHQAAVSARSKIAYALGREPEVVDLGALQAGPLVPDDLVPGAAASVTGWQPDRARVVVVLPDETLDDPATLPALMALDTLPEFRLTLLVSGRAREQLKGSRFSALSAFGLSEVAPSGFARLGDVAAIYGADLPGERIAAMVTGMFVSGRIVVDCTAGAVIAASGAPALRGPLDPAALADYLRHTVMVNRAEIAGRVAESAWVDARRIEETERLLRLPEPERNIADGTAGRMIFLPTNGNGLGHARRCTLIAREMPAESAIGFAAFPSCVPLIRAAGYDCLPLVQKSGFHPAEHANDLVNYMRLRRTLRPGDRLVFDGGYVFDSICRTIVEKALDAIWVRRGLWQAGQINAAALDRERVFRRVIVPTEAFAELNRDMSFGDHVRKVGPVVGDRPATDRADLRARLAERLGVRFDALVVTMLGGGIAADRTAQAQVLCALMERREACLHLVLIWPGSPVAPALYGWKNTRVCQTRSAADFAAAADLVISAAGYNSFHEILYHRIPAIFIPQMAAYMDDQERRAQAAADRGLSLSVAAEDLLMLERKVISCLDGGDAEGLRKALAEAVLPERGNARAAELIAEDRA